MVICDICSGRHLTSRCVTATRFVEECFIRIADEAPRPSNVVELVTALTYAKQPTGRRADIHHRRQARDHQGIEVLRLA